MLLCACRRDKQFPSGRSSVARASARTFSANHKAAAKANRIEKTERPTQRRPASSPLSAPNTVSGQPQLISAPHSSRNGPLANLIASLGRPFFPAASSTLAMIDCAHSLRLVRQRKGPQTEQQWNARVFLLAACSPLRPPLRANEKPPRPLLCRPSGLARPNWQKAAQLQRLFFSVFSAQKLDQFGHNFDHHSPKLGHTQKQRVVSVDEKELEHANWNSTRKRPRAVSCPLYAFCSLLSTFCCPACPRLELAPTNHAASPKCRPQFARPELRRPKNQKSQKSQKRDIKI